MRKTDQAALKVSEPDGSLSCKWVLATKVDDTALVATIIIIYMNIKLD